MSVHYKFALVGKFGPGMPPISRVRARFVKMHLKGFFQVGQQNENQVLINLSCEEDFTRVWTRQEWLVDGHSMRISKWVYNMSFSEDSPIAPVWVGLPQLPAVFTHKKALRNIALLLGKPLKLDESTVDRIRPKIARFCVEINLLEPITHAIWLGDDTGSFTQKVVYENLPSYCLFCHHIGHTEDSCFEKHHTPNDSPSCATTPDFGPSVHRDTTSSILPKSMKNVIFNENKETNFQNSNANSNLIKEAGAFNKFVGNEVFEKENYVPILETLEQGELIPSGDQAVSNVIVDAVETIKGSCDNTIINSHGELRINNFVEYTEKDLFVEARTRAFRRISSMFELYDPDDGFAELFPPEDGLTSSPFIGRSSIIQFQEEVANPNRSDKVDNSCEHDANQVEEEKKFLTPRNKKKRNKRNYGTSEMKTRNGNPRRNCP